MSRKRFSAHRRGGGWGSLGKIEQPAGTADGSRAGAGDPPVTPPRVRPDSGVWRGERRREVNAGDVGSVLLAKARADARPPVAALGAVALVSEPGHQDAPCGSDPFDAPSRPGRLVAEAVSG